MSTTQSIAWACIFLVGWSIGCDPARVSPTSAVSTSHLPNTHDVPTTRQSNALPQAAPLGASPRPTAQATTLASLAIVRRNDPFAESLTAEQTARVLAAAERARPDGRPTWFVYLRTNYKPLLAPHEFWVSIYYTPDRIHGRVRRGKRITLSGENDGQLALYDYLQVLRPGQSNKDTGAPRLRDLPIFWRDEQEKSLGLSEADLTSLVDFAREAFEKSRFLAGADEFIKSIHRRGDVYEIETDRGSGAGHILRVKRQAGRWVGDGHIDMVRG
jgi:hypothetical protein